MDRPPKSEVANALLSKGSVYFHFDPRVDNVVIPKWLKDQPQVVLQFGLAMTVPIPDLHVDEDGISGTLSFSRSPFACFLPWEAVFAMAGDDGRGMVWPESMPPEILAEIEREAGRRAPPEPGEAFDEEEDDDEAAAELSEIADKRVIPLRPVPPPAAEPHAPVAADAEAEKTLPVAARKAPTKGKRELPPYLRVVK